VNLDTPQIPSRDPGAALPPAESPRYLRPADGGDISVRQVNYGGKSIAHELIEAVVLSLLIFLLVQSLVQNRKVVGQSMEPSLQNDEHLLIDRLSYFRYDTNAIPRLLGQQDLIDNEAYLLSGPKRGDIIVFRPPVDDQDYIKRVIGVPWETVQVKAYDGVYINGHKLDEPYIKDDPDYNWPAAGQSGTEPADHVFVLGDNRRNSSDSHAWGFLNINSIIGKAWISYWPRDVWGLLPHPSYASVGDGSPAP